MDTSDLNNRLVAIGAKIKAKGWASASVNVYVEYLAIFDREMGPHDPMIHCRPSIRASTRDKYNIPTAHEFVKDFWGCKTMDQALEALEATAEAMPTMAEESARIESVKAKLSDDDRRLLGVR